ncbi:DUF2189 domain-containing protein [Phaeobacter gallaeciensis]|uniref:Integral membrane protein n=1 Tax=Phaeobacter gallaeciensis TaxID=60890 RepID=A0AAC9Z848_9RHOB|nr:DUF2189 domain-containing protein [Phaeobacter gallaeciensis]AHD08895.1 putative integral membrane protein [Phaeobacter gallaeciensis DSM 26640]ATE92161.1 putative integral membrane protein [Phaeobacter gallaeciensis]ATE98020.1 putative integral membrane protein [Phaeobacter gallaeciensis]ATF00823.1 putative integral membrane protein [Phaeobacter gallaeciensis]ATF05203.1 putative integral membrane protein [Phaeobacter gallaeciensis]
MTAAIYSKARVIQENPAQVVQRWLVAGWRDLRANPGFSLGYGMALVLGGWALIWLLSMSGTGWMLLPLLAGGVLIGPVATVGLYAVARGKREVASKGQIALVGAILMVFALTWIRAATVLFAIVYGLRPFAGFTETLQLLLSTQEGWVLMVTGSLTGGLFAALGFAVSAFSIPMLVDRKIDGFSAMGLSFNAATHNFWLCVWWGAAITFLIALGILTGLLGLAIVFPLLGYATWHAYADLFHGDA